LSATSSARACRRSPVAEVGGAAWVPFLVAFLIATITAFSYLELITKYPQAAGAALYAHKAFGVQFVTFLVAFGLIFYVPAFANSNAIAVLGGTTSLLLLAVFAMVNVAALVPVGIGIALFFVTMAINRQLGIRDAGITDPTHLGSAPD